MAYEQILYEVKDRIATITLNRPERLNAWTDTIAEEVYAAMRAADTDKEVRVIILTGAGKGFCAGGDIGKFADTTPYGLIHKLPRPFDMHVRADYQTRASWIPTVSKPVIAMINGPAAGLGLVHALFCDLRFASEDAVMTTAYSRIGVAGEYGMAWILERIVGHANALDLLLSARKVRGQEALRLGLVNQIHPADQLKEATYAYARELAEKCSPSAMRLIKRELYEVPFQTLAEAVIKASDDMYATAASADFAEGTKAFMEKRPPQFTGE